MAPILSKAMPPPPRNSAEKIDRMVKKARPLLDSMFEILKDVGSMGIMCKTEAESVWDRVRDKLDTACVGCVRLLEGLCCLDINRFAKPEKPLTGTLPILFVLAIIVMLYNAFVFGYMPAAGIAINSHTSLLFHALIFMVLTSFSQAVRTDPGSAPMDSRWRRKDHPPAEAKERKHSSHEARWCRKSNAYKPDRAHYCRVLKKGVLRMDHYCPWLGNTVGFHNQKFFFLFLLYTNAACAQLGISFLQLLVQYSLPALTTFCLIGAEGLTVLVTSLLVPFFAFHFWLIARNTTTIEFCERMRSAGEDKNDSEGGGFPRYDLGVFGNFSAVLGSNPLLWLLPVGAPPGDGIAFPLNPSYEQAIARAVAAAMDVEQPEATHPAGCSGEDAAKKAGTQGLSSKGVKGDVEGDGEEVQEHDGEVAQASGEDGECESYEEELEEELEASEEEGSLAAGSGSGGNDEGFLVWRTSAEFAEDLTIGCQFLGEKAEDCAKGCGGCVKGSFLSFFVSCVPGPWGRKAARSLASSRAAPWKRSLSSHSFSESSRRSLRGTPAVRIVPVRSASSGAGEGDSVSSASSDDRGHFLSD